MTESSAKSPEGMHTITPHIVVSDAAGALHNTCATSRVRRLRKPPPGCSASGGVLVVA